MCVASTCMLWVGVAHAVVAVQEDPASLERLADIVTPPPVSSWPPAPGWYVVMVVALVMVAGGALEVWRRRQRNAYRVAALAELARAPHDAAGVTRIAEILKRAALVAARRERVASLSGAQWVQWLNRTGNGASISEVSTRLLTQHLYDSGQPTAKEIDDLASDARTWIAKHRAPATEE